MRRLLLLSVVCIFFTGCFSPKYKRPDLLEPLPTEYKEEEGWKTATPQDTLDRGDWWTLFKDPELDALIQKANIANQNIAIAASNFRQARAQIGSTRAAFFPAIEGSGSSARSRSGSLPIQSAYSAGVSASWEISFWNSLPAFEAAKAQAEASIADYATMKLSVQSELAQTYFQMRTIDGQIDLYESTIATYAKALQLTRSQYEGGISTPSDVAQAEAQLASAEADLANLQQQRATLEHSLAILTGRLPSSFSIGRRQLVATLPNIPISVPSELLERRPDIASAERKVAAANEQIGIARAAWFPSFSIGGSVSRQLSAWHGTPLSVWSLGPSLAMSLFQGGKHLADSESAQAQYEASVATYRKAVLEAFKEVEDQLSSLQYLEKESKARYRAVIASQTALRLSLSQYRGGIITYLQVVNTQTTSLNNERQAIQVKGQRLIAAVNLIKALGGGWSSASLDSMKKGQSIPLEGSLK